MARTCDGGSGDRYGEQAGDRAVGELAAEQRPFLLSPAGGHLTGVMLPVDCGALGTL
jgi:hypothetical protein